MAGWNNMLGGAFGTVSEAQRKVDDDNRQVMADVRRINAQASAANIYADINPSDGALSSDAWRMRSLAMRLRVKEGHKFPFQHISTAWAGDKVFIFVLSKGQPVTFEDDAALFPSDTIITALRLIQE